MPDFGARESSGVLPCLLPAPPSPPAPPHSHAPLCLAQNMDTGVVVFDELLSSLSKCLYALACPVSAAPQYPFCRLLLVGCGVQGHHVCVCAEVQGGEGRGRLKVLLAGIGQCCSDESGLRNLAVLHCGFCKQQF